MNRPHLYYFQPEEWGDWLYYMSPRLMVLGDVFRTMWGKPCRLRFPSDGNHIGGRLGRHLGDDSGSDHNIDKWGEVRGMDIFPDGMDKRSHMELAIELATEIGVTSIGIYPHTAPSPMIHLGVRHDRRPGKPVTWGAIRSTPGDVSEPMRYVSMIVALEQAPI